jgi:hypothetical protein
MNRLLFILLFVYNINKKIYTEINYKNNANLDFKDNETSVSFKYYKKILEERKEKKRHKELLY